MAQPPAKTVKRFEEPQAPHVQEQPPQVHVQAPPPQVPPQAPPQQAPPQQAPWEFDANATAFAQEVIQAEPQPLYYQGVDTKVRMYSLTKGLQEDDREEPLLFVRKCQRQVWKDVLRDIDDKHTKTKHAVVSGNPGIGKSRSLTYFLRLLLKRGETVLFECRKAPTVRYFQPVEGGYRVYMRPIEDNIVNTVVKDKFLYKCLRNVDNWHLIDPAQASTSPPSYGSHVILAASPNPAHFHDFAKGPYCRQFVMPAWREDELQAIRQSTHDPCDHPRKSHRTVHLFWWHPSPCV